MDLLGLTPEALEARIAKLGPADRRRALELAQRARQALERNPLWRFSTDGHPKQDAWLGWGGPRTTKLFIGGNRSGKTTGGVVDDIVQCVDRGALPEGLQRFKVWEPPFFCRVVTPDFKNSHQVMVDKFREWVPRDQLRAGRFDRAFDGQAKRLWFRNGSWVEFMSQEQDLDAFAARALHRVHFDEEPLHERGLAIFNECRWRLIDHGGDTLVTMTPLIGMSWVYDKLFLPFEQDATDAQGRRVRDSVLVTTVSIHDNPHLDVEGKRHILADPTLSAEEREAREHGRFVAFEGLIYPDFDAGPGGHVVPELRALPAERNVVVVGIDPGMREVDGGGTGVVWVLQGLDGSVTVFDELKIAGQPVEAICREIQLVNARWGLQRPDWYVIDPAARNRSLDNARKLQAEYARNGVSAQFGQNDVSTGISRCRALMQRQPVDPLDERKGVLPPRFRLAANCTEFRDELRRYRWTTAKRSEHAPKEQPVKRYDHEMDAFRYAVMSLPILEQVAPVDPRWKRDRMAQADFDAMLEEMQGVGGSSSPYGPGFFE